MTAVDPLCLHTQLASIVATAEAGNVDAVRVQLTSMLRCASHLSCTEAVACSDDAMTLLRRVLGRKHRS